MAELVVVGSEKEPFVVKRTVDCIVVTEINAKSNIVVLVFLAFQTKRMRGVKGQHDVCDIMAKCIE